MLIVESLWLFLVIVGVAGWLPGLLVKGFGYVLIGNIVIGVVGAFIAGWIFPTLGISLGTGIVAAILHATIGATVLLLLIRVLKRA